MVCGVTSVMPAAAKLCRHASRSSVSKPSSIDRDASGDRPSGGARDGAPGRFEGYESGACERWGFGLAAPDAKTGREPRDRRGRILVEEGLPDGRVAAQQGHGEARRGGAAGGTCRRIGRRRTALTDPKVGLSSMSKKIAFLPSFIFPSI